MRILLIGGVDFSQHCLQELLKAGGDLVGVITLSAERSSAHADFCDLGPLCQKHGVPCFRVKNINDPESMERIRSLEPDVIFIFGWSQLIKQPILDLPPLGCIGTHPALLPRNRGRHPLIWALVEGLKESGLTFFYLDEGADSGDILWQQPFAISMEDDAGSLYEKIKQLATQAIHEFLPELQQGTAPRIQQDHSQATYWRKRGESDGEIDWAEPSLTSYNLIRALTHPYCGAHTFCCGQRILVWKSRLPTTPLSENALRQPAGTILRCSEGILEVRTQDGYLQIIEFSTELPLSLEVGSLLGGKL